MRRGVTWGADATGGAAHALPPSLGVLWAYVTGTTQHPDIAWTPAQLSMFPQASVYTIDQGFGSKGAFDADEFDVEVGAWTAAEAVNIIEVRAARSWSTRVYCSHADRAVIMAALPPWGQSSVFFRIADWSVDEATAAARLGGNIYAWQWASPSSNPGTILPGTGLTLAEANADLNVISLRSTEWQG